MPEHKMVTIDGIRVRSDEAARYRARTAPSAGGQAPPLTQAQADPRAQEKSEETEEGGGFDPAEHTILQVMAHLAEADEDETARILDLEAKAEKPRAGLIDRRAELLEEARKRASGGGGS